MVQVMAVQAHMGAVKSIASGGGYIASGGADDLIRRDSTRRCDAQGVCMCSTLPSTHSSHDSSGPAAPMAVWGRYPRSRRSFSLLRNFSTIFTRRLFDTKAGVADLGFLAHHSGEPSESKSRCESGDAC